MTKDAIATATPLSETDLDQVQGGKLGNFEIQDLMSRKPGSNLGNFEIQDLMSRNPGSNLGNFEIQDLMSTTVKPK